MTPCTAQSGVGRAVPIAMMDTTYDSLPCPVRFWKGSANGNDGYNL